MALQRARLADIQYLPSTAASIYTNPTGTKTHIKGFIFFNNNTTAETVKIYNVPDSTGSAGTATAANQFLEIDVGGKDTVFIEIPYVIMLVDGNDSIQGSSTSASMVTVQVLGDKE
jgi:hypothetical protein